MPSFYFLRFKDVTLFVSEDEKKSLLLQYQITREQVFYIHQHPESCIPKVMVGWERRIGTC
jgi:hypothetical protein